MTYSTALEAAQVAGALWGAMHANGGCQRPVTDGHVRLPQAFAADWLAALPLPVDEYRPRGAPVALLTDQPQFDRYDDATELAGAYTAHRRTKVYEDVGRDVPDAWYALAAVTLGRLAARQLSVVCSLFQSSLGDESLGAHRDGWYGAIIQLRGAKAWDIGPALLDPESTQPTHQVTTRPGDILLLPKGLPHRVKTPEHPGHSLHLSFAIDRDSPDD